MFFTDEQPFLDAIFNRYHDDGPRLVYADFLDDAGEPERAELVRVQLALSKLPDEHPRRPELANRQAELRAAYYPQWTEHLRGLVTGVEFRRGVLDSVTVDAETFLATGEELFRRVRVRRLSFRDSAQVMPKLVESSLLAAIRELDFCSNDLGNGGLNLLTRSPFLKDLDALDLGFNGLEDAGIVALARSSALESLTTLSLNDNPAITSEGAAALAESPFYAGLTTLDLSGNDVNEVGIRALVTEPALPRLHTLRLNDNPIGDGLAFLARSPLLARMLAHTNRLEFRANALNAVGATAFAANPILAKCRSLDVSSNYLGDEGFAALVSSPHLGNLRALKIANNQVTDAGLSAVREYLPGLLGRLRLLDLCGNKLTRYGIGLLHGARGESGLRLEYAGNVQSSSGGEAPVAVGDVVPDVLQGVAEAAELRRRISHPRTLPSDWPR